MPRIARYGTCNGYLVIKVYGDPLVPEGKKIYEHRYVLMVKLGRRLRKGEEAHHKDHNKKNNKPSNIIRKTKFRHQSDHCKEWWANASLERRQARGAAISKAKKGKPQPWAIAIGKAQKGVKRSKKFKQAVSSSMQKYCASLPPGEMARRARRKK